MCKDNTWVFCASQNQVDRDQVLRRIQYPHLDNPFAHAVVEEEPADDANTEVEEEDAGFARMDEAAEELQMAGMLMDGADDDE